MHCKYSNESAKLSMLVAPAGTSKETALCSSPLEDAGSVLPVAHTLHGVHEVGKGVWEVGPQRQRLAVGCDGLLMLIWCMQDSMG